MFGICTVFIGFWYGMWSITKNVLASIEIEHTGLSDTVIVGILNIAFVIFLILGSFLGARIYEVFGAHGILFFFGTLGLAGILSWGIYE